MMICIDSDRLSDLPNDRPYSPIEAEFSYRLDQTHENTLSISGYAKLWQWDRKKVRKFIASLPQVSPQNLPRQLPTFETEKQSLTEKAPQVSPQNLPTERDTTLKRSSLNSSSSLGDPNLTQSAGDLTHPPARVALKDEEWPAGSEAALKLKGRAYLPHEIGLWKAGVFQIFQHYRELRKLKTAMSPTERDRRSCEQLVLSTGGDLNEMARLIKAFLSKTDNSYYVSRRFDLECLCDDFYKFDEPQRQARVVEMPTEPTRGSWDKDFLKAQADRWRVALGMEAKA